MKHWQEFGQILDRVLACARDGRATALATVVRIRGSAYRRPGARLLVDESGAIVGGVSGGCLEEDVRQVGLQVLRTGASRVLHYATGDDESRVWGLGLGCDGEVDLVVQAITDDARATCARARERLDGDEPFALTVTVEDAGRGDLALAPARGHRTGLHTDGGRRVFTEVLTPPSTLLVCGAGDDSRPLVAFAAAAGFRVVVADHRSGYLTADRFPQARRLLLMGPDEDSADLPVDTCTCAVVKMHSLTRDAEWVRRLADTDVPYIGVLGPRARTEKIVAGLPPPTRARIFGPVGLDLGADGPEQVALSILAEVLAVSAGRAPLHLRDRQVSVHA